VGGQPRPGLAAVDATTGALGAFNPGLNDGVVELERTGNILVVGGHFTQFVGQPRSRIGALDLTTQTATSFNVTPAGFVNNATTGNFTSVSGIDVVGDVVYFGGNFTSVSGSPRTHAAAASLSTSSLLPFAPLLGGPALDIDVQGADAYLSGIFFQVNGQAYPTASALAIVDAATGLTNRTIPTLFGQGFHVRAVSGGVFAGGANFAPDFSSFRFYPEAAMGGVPGPPSTPTIYTFTVNSVGRLAMDWSPSALGGPATSYIVEAGSGPGRSDIGAINNGTDEPTFSYEGVPPGLYYTRVRAVGPGGVSPPSREVAFAAGGPGCTGPPHAPPFNAGVSGITVDLNWAHAIGNGSTYRLHAGTALGDASIGTFNLGNATSFSAAAGPGAFFTRMQALNPCGISALTGDHLISVAGVAPPAPPAATSIVAGNTVTIQWNAVPGATGYKLDAGTGPTLANVVSFPTPNTSLTAPGVPSGTYYVRIFAIGAAGTSFPSNELVVIVP
jgi:hypothetical protein